MVKGASLVTELERRFVTARETVSLASGALELLRPRDAEALISEEAFALDERLPYWADLWPSSLVLAGEVGAESGGGRALLELGCGLGLVTVAAMRAGYDALATDYYDDALLFTRANAWLSLGREPRVRHVNWRALPPELERAERVVASDVLYERPYGELLAEAIDATLAEDGRATVADPGRVAADTFVTACGARGFDVRVESRPWSAGPIRQTIRLYEITRR